MFIYVKKNYLSCKLKMEAYYAFTMFVVLWYKKRKNLMVECGRQSWFWESGYQTSCLGSATYDPCNPQQAIEALY